MYAGFHILNNQAANVALGRTLKGPIQKNIHPRFTFNLNKAGYINLRCNRNNGQPYGAEIHDGLPGYFVLQVKFPF
jgi:hypothetical protein